MKTTMDRILTAINVGGYTISAAMDSELYGISVVLDPPFIIKRKVYDSDLKVINKTTICCTKKCVFYIDSDDPSKLHKFTGMKYEGLVDNPHFDHVGEKLKEMVKKFDGCFVHQNYHTGTSYLITKEKIYSIGCNKGVSNVLEHVLIQLPAPSGDHMAGSIFGRIDASMVPHSWTWNPSYDNEVLSVCEKLKDVEP